MEFIVQYLPDVVVVVIFLIFAVIYARHGLYRSLAGGPGGAAVLLPAAGQRRQDERKDQKDRKHPFFHLSNLASYVVCET